MPGLEKAMAASQRSKCGSNLKAIGTALGTYLNDSISRNYPKAPQPAANIPGWYTLFGKKGSGTYAPYALDPQNRPLNKYLGVTSTLTGAAAAGIEAKIAECPSDAGDATIDPDGPTTSIDGMGLIMPTGTMAAGVSNVYAVTGSSYIAAAGDYYGIKEAFFSPMKASDAKPPASKVLVGDSPIYGDRKFYPTAGDRRHRWHSANKNVRAFNIVYADYHVDYYTFPPLGDSRNIEALANNAPSNPSRGYW